MMIPSVSGGLGHIGRTAALARALERIDSTVTIEYLLDMERIRPLNIDAAAATGHRVNLLPLRDRSERDAVVRASFRDVDLVVEDTARHLIPFRALVPQAAWVSVPMYPLWDELFMDWPLLAQTDGVIWAYPPTLDFPAELNLTGTKILRTGPFLELAAVPNAVDARERLGIAPDEKVIIYAPRGMAFGRAFGEQVLSALIGAVCHLREQYGVRLILASVSRREDLRGAAIPDPLPDCVDVLGPLAPATMLSTIRAADIAVTEGSNMTFEAAALGTPIVMVPGSIYETWILGTRLSECGGAAIQWIEAVTTESMTTALRELFDNAQIRQARVEAATAFIQSGGGAEAAARFCLEAVALSRVRAASR